MPDSIDLQPDTQTEGLRKYGRVPVDRFDKEVPDTARNGYKHAKEIREQASGRLPSPILDAFANAGIDVIGFEQKVNATAGASGTPLVANVTGAIGVQYVWLTNPPSDTDHGPHMYVFATQGANDTESIPSRNSAFPGRLDARLFVAQYAQSNEYTLAEWDTFHESLEARLLSGSGLGSDTDKKICLVAGTWRYLSLELSIPPAGGVCIRNSTFKHGRWLIEYLSVPQPPDPRSFSPPRNQPATLHVFSEPQHGTAPMPDNAFADNDIVEVSGTDFTTPESGTVEYFGANNAELRERSSEEIAGWFETWNAKLQCNGNQQLDVLRAPAFGCDPDRCLPLEPASERYWEPALEQLDDLVAQCERNGVRLILYLTNYWTWQGGIPKYLQWHGHISEDRYEEVRDQEPDENKTIGDDKKRKFYTDQDLRNHYKSHIDTILDRTNTITGRQYKNDPTIMMWELANEPRPAGDEEKFLTWIKECADYIDNKYSGDRNQLISTGLGANYTKSDPVPSYFEKAHGKQNIDAWSMHLWVDPPHTDLGISVGKKILEKHSKKAANKNMPFYVGEFGWHDDPDTDDGHKKRDEAFQAWQRLLAKANAALVWDLRTQYDEPAEWDYGVFSDHSSTIGHLKTIAGCEGE